jgi:hypothetical protein
MKRYALIVGLDEQESQLIRTQLNQPIISHAIIPKIRILDGELYAETGRGVQMVSISSVVYHGIYEDDLEFITGLGFWGGPCLPNPRGMMDLRLKLPGLLRALDHTQFGHPRGFVSANTMIHANKTERVAKWGNWHCGENKERFTENWSGESASIIEPFLNGQAVRVAIIGDKYWQIKLDGDSWLKTIHHDQANFMDVDHDLLDDTRNIQSAFNIEIIANDYIVMPNGDKYLLEVNHIPNVTRFPDMWKAYLEFVVQWVNAEAVVE